MAAWPKGRRSVKRPESEGPVRGSERPPEAGSETWSDHGSWAETWSGVYWGACMFSRGVVEVDEDEGDWRAPTSNSSFRPNMQNNPDNGGRLKMRQPSPSPSFTVLSTLERRVQELVSINGGDRAGATGREVEECLAMMRRRLEDDAQRTMQLQRRAEDAEGQIGSLRVELKNQQLKARIEASPLFGGASHVSAEHDDHLARLIEELKELREENERLRGSQANEDDVMHLMEELQVTKGRLAERGDQGTQREHDDLKVRCMELESRCEELQVIADESHDLYKRAKAAALRCSQDAKQAMEEVRESARMQAELNVSLASALDEIDRLYQSLQSQSGFLLEYGPIPEEEDLEAGQHGGGAAGCQAGAGLPSPPSQSPGKRRVAKGAAKLSGVLERIEARTQGRALAVGSTFQVWKLKKEVRRLEEVVQRQNSDLRAAHNKVEELRTAVASNEGASGIIQSLMRQMNSVEQEARQMQEEARESLTRSSAELKQLIKHKQAQVDNFNTISNIINDCEGRMRERKHMMMDGPGSPSVTSLDSPRSLDHRWQGQGGGPRSVMSAFNDTPDVGVQAVDAVHRLCRNLDNHLEEQYELIRRYERLLQDDKGIDDAMPHLR